MSITGLLIGCCLGRCASLCCLCAIDTSTAGELDPMKSCEGIPAPSGRGDMPKSKPHVCVHGAITHRILERGGDVADERPLDMCKPGAQHLTGPSPVSRNQHSKLGTQALRKETSANGP